MKGIFLGAGASYEVGIPLVWEFSNTLRANVLKRIDSNLFTFKSNSFKEKFINLLSDKNKHYEEVVGELEQLYLSDKRKNSFVYPFIIQLVDCIQILFVEEQNNTLKLLSEKIKDYYGIKNILKEQGVTNIFSLNHDIVFEEIFDFYNIPYKDGFYNCKSKYENISNFKSISADQLSSGELNFFEEDETGFNLVKLHGSIDIFAAEDKKLFLKSYGDGKSVGSHLTEIIKIEEHNIDMMKENRVRTTNELCVYDSDNEIQFLRRSLLTGAHKFQYRFEQIAPIALFEIFKRKINSINELIVIGYSFGDSHINDVLNSWLSKSSNKVIIYDPYRESVPNFLSNNEKQITLIKGGLTDFFLSYNDCEETKLSINKRNAIETIRERLKKRRLSQ